MADILIKDLNIDSTQKATIVLDYGRAYVGHGVVDIEPQKSKDLIILEKHGRIGDIDELLHKINIDIANKCDDLDELSGSEIYDLIFNSIKEFSYIIEANK